MRLAKIPHAYTPESHFLLEPGDDIAGQATRQEMTMGVPGSQLRDGSGGDTVQVPTFLHTSMSKLVILSCSR